MRNRKLEETTEIPCIGKLFSSTPTGISPSRIWGGLEYEPGVRAHQLGLHVGDRDRDEKRISVDVVLTGSEHEVRTISHN